MSKFPSCPHPKQETSGKPMDHKFCVLESSKPNLLNVNKSAEIDNISSILMTGSLNWTVRGYPGNYENILLTNQEQMI
uniref:Phospholipase D-like domain-containing protein n=1 Tax=Glossina palpalis gambiensis TaxID=67801 RepID=A0A1B0BZY9_9MUSC